MRQIVTDQRWAPQFIDWFAARVGVPGQWADPEHTVLAHVNVQADGTATHSDILAVVLFNHWTPHTVEGNIASDGSARWASRDFLWTIYDYVFRHAGKSRFNFQVSPDNTAAVAMHQKLGHHFDCRLVDAAGEGHDLLLYSLTRAQWQAGRYAKPAPTSVNTEQTGSE